MACRHSKLLISLMNPAHACALAGRGVGLAGCSTGTDCQSTSNMSKLLTALVLDIDSSYLLVCRGAPDWQRVCLGVEDPLVKGQHVGVVLKQQVEVLEGLSQEEGLHLVGKTRRHLPTVAIARHSTAQCGSVMRHMKHTGPCVGQHLLKHNTHTHSHNPASLPS